MRACVLCFGNSWHGDDGFGPAVYEQLQSLQLPDNTEVYSVECKSLQAAPLMHNCSLLVIVDASHNPNSSPGSFGWAEIQDLEPFQPGVQHAGSVEELIAHLPILLAGEPMPQIKLMLASIADTQPFTPRLSRVIRQAVPKAAKEIGRLLHHFQRSCA